MMVILVASYALASASTSGDAPRSRLPRGDSSSHADGLHKPARLETLWIFEADFENESGDNAGWTVHDMSGTVGYANAWHKDTIRINGFAYLGDSTWWCGKYSDCWVQPRGYGNSWRMILKRSFPEVAAQTDPGDPLTLEWDQRFAMENDYDYGYVDVSSDGGSSWTTLHTVNNGGFAGKPGFSSDWDHPSHGHVSLDLSALSGQTLDVRFRFESDLINSSQDTPDNPPSHSFLDGAWQLDNIEWTGPSGAFWLDDCESPGNNGWDNSDPTSTGQTGVVWWRGQFGYDFVTGRSYTCDDRPIGTWMYAPVDPFTSAMVDNEHTVLMSPPIDISGAPKLVGKWDCWADAPLATGDVFDLFLASNDLQHCVLEEDGFVDEEFGAWYAEADWYTRTDDWDAFAGNDWLAIQWIVRSDPASGNGEHWGGLFLNWQKVGVPSGDAGTTWERSDWENFNDWFWEHLDQALEDTTRILIKDDDGIASAYVVATADGGASWESYACYREDPGNPGNLWWHAPPPSSQMARGNEIRYYFEATDGVGNVSTFPAGAPGETFEMSILPLAATTDQPGILLVDKHGRATPGALRYAGEQLESLALAESSERYYREMLEILGFEYEIYDVEVPSGNILSDGPDTTGMKYYDTQIWFTNDFDAFTLNPIDQYSLIEWLSRSAEGKERNLLLTGNDIGYELVETERETLAFYGTWIASEYLDDAVGAVTVDSVPGLEDHAGDNAFMTHLDGECIARGACPLLNSFDVVEPSSGLAGTETVVDYIRLNGERRPAGVAYTHPTMGYQTVNLGFGMEFMMDGTFDGGSSNYTPEGYYHTGIEDRVDLMQNIMAFFAKTPTADGTGIAGGAAADVLSGAYPNPFNPSTTIEYGVREAGRASIRVYSVSGRLVRTLLDEELAAGDSGVVVWDGEDETGNRCASGVYFARIEAPGFSRARKMVMLK
jgi:hypothetical protein